LGILPNGALKAGDIVINPEGTGGTLTVQIPRFALDAKNPQGQDISFKVTIDGHGASWKQIQSTNTDRVLAIAFGNNNRFIEITGTQVDKSSFNQTKEISFFIYFNQKLHQLLVL
jgi:hypothetical protein